MNLGTFTFLPGDDLFDNVGLEHSEAMSLEGDSCIWLELSFRGNNHLNGICIFSIELYFVYEKIIINKNKFNLYTSKVERFP